MVASTKKGNIPFNDATAAGIILATCRTEWRNQYEMNHRTVPESVRAMLQDLEIIEKVCVEHAKNTARASKAKTSTAPKSGGPRCLGSTVGRAVLRDQPPRKDVPPSIANGVRRLAGPLPCTTPLSVPCLTGKVSS